MRAIMLRDEIYLRSMARKGLLSLRPLSNSFSITYSNDQTLEAALSKPFEPPIAAVLIFHGIGERLEYWHSVQTLLAQHGIASLIFHYSGYGKSSGTITTSNLHNNAHAAYSELRKKVPSNTPIFLLGFSMGTAVATDVASHLSPPAQGLILCEGFPSLREAAACITSSSRLPYLLPDVWRTIDSVRTLTQPLLIIHSHADRLFPVEFAHRVHRSAQSQKVHLVELFLAHGFSHNEPYLNPKLTYWQPILDFVSHHAGHHAYSSSRHTQTLNR
jgi:hypothetical protein